MSTASPIEPVPPASTRRGCWKGALLGCGGAAVLCVLALIGLGWWVQRNPTFVTDLLMDSIRERFASDVTEQDKADLEAAYAEFRKAVEVRRVRQADLERVRRTVGLRGEVRRDEVVELTRIYREAAGTPDAKQGSRDETPEEITPAPEATPTP